MEWPPFGWTAQTIAAVMGSVATALAVVVALFKEEIVRLWRRPNLTATIRLIPPGPDCHKTEIVIQSPATGHVLARGDCYYFRLWVENKGRQRAEKVQVFAARALKKDAGGEFREVKKFVPMNLRWANSHEIFADGISAGMGKHCDLGHIEDPQLRTLTGNALPNVPPDKTIFILDLEVSPNTLTHLLEPAIYQLHLKLAASNARPKVKRLEITLTGQWFPDEQKMFSDGIGIVELN